MDKNKRCVIYCASCYAQEAFVRLSLAGYEIAAFVDNSPEKQHQRLLGRMTYGYRECREKFPDAVYVIANENLGVACAIGRELERDGFRKGSTCYIYQDLKSSLHLPGVQECWGSYFKERDIVLIGERYLCELFRKNKTLYGQKAVIAEEESIGKLHDKYPCALWIILTRGMRDGDGEKASLYEKMLREKGVENCTRYFSTYFDYCVEEERERTAENERLSRYRIDKVLFLKKSAFAGATLINGMMSVHPHVLCTDFCLWGINIWTIVKEAARTDASGMAAHIAEMMLAYQKKDMGVAGQTPKSAAWVKDFQRTLEAYFTGRAYTEREIFLYLYLAYYEHENGREAPPGSYVIYIDIHNAERLGDTMLGWLKRMNFDVVLLEMIRRPYMRLGCIIRYLTRDNGKLSGEALTFSMQEIALETASDIERELPILKIRFEDMKLHPDQVWEKICEILDIAWDEKIREAFEKSPAGSYIVSDNVVKGFDTKPVYYSYDEFFDAFDRLRLDMVFQEKNKAYGYSFVEEEKYPPEFDDRIRLFEIPFRFESYMEFSDDEKRAAFRAGFAVFCKHLSDVSRGGPGADLYGGYVRIEDMEGKKVVTIC